MDNNFFQFTNDSKNKAVEKIKNGIQKYLIIIVLLFNVGLSIVSKLYQLGLQNPFSQGFFVDFIISTGTSMICYICFIPFGRSDEMNRSKSFSDNFKLWQNLSEKVRRGYLRSFYDFCDEQEEYERNDKKKLELANHTMMSYETYLANYKGKSKKEIRKLYRSGKITAAEKNAIIKCNQMKVKPINPLVVLQEVQSTHYNDAGRDSSSQARTKTIQRPITIFIVSLIINTITVSFLSMGENFFIEMLLSIFSIIVASIGGYSTGVGDFIEKENKIKAKIIFLSLFNEYENKIEDKQYEALRREGICSDMQGTELQQSQKTNCG